MKSRHVWAICLAVLIALSTGVYLALRPGLPPLHIAEGLTEADRAFVLKSYIFFGKACPGLSKYSGGIERVDATIRRFEDDSPWALEAPPRIMDYRMALLHWHSYVEFRVVTRSSHTFTADRDLLSEKGRTRTMRGKTLLYNLGFGGKAGILAPTPWDQWLCGFTLSPDGNEVILSHELFRGVNGYRDVFQGTGGRQPL